MEKRETVTVCRMYSEVNAHAKCKCKGKLHTRFTTGGSHPKTWLPGLLTPMLNANIIIIIIIMII